MTTSSYMADAKVEIAFDSGYATPAADRTWTDVSEYVELQYGMTIQVGRQDERSQVDANQLTLTLDNSDGRFTPGKADGPYYPNVKLYRPIRVTATPVDGEERVRFLGYINAWPQEWEGSDGYSKVTISASSRLARLGVTTKLKSIVEQTILADSPDLYYTLGEPSGATQANDSSGNDGPPLTLAGDADLPVTFGEGTGVGTDGMPAAQFQGGQRLTGESPGAAIAFAGFFYAGSAPAAAQTIVTVGTTELRLETDGKAAVYNLGFLVRATANSVVGRTHHFYVVRTPSGVFYLDGELVGSAVMVLATSARAISVGTTFMGTLSHFEVYSGVLSEDRVLAHAEAGLRGFAGETTDERLERYAAMAQIPAAEVSAQTGSTTMSHIDTTDKQAIELMRAVEQTEGGVLFDAPDGTLTLHNRAHRYKAESIYTLTMEDAHELEADYSPRLDATALLNDVTASNGENTITARRFDQDSINDYGHIADTPTTYSENPDAPLHLASWKLHQYKEPKERVPQLSVNALAQVGSTPSCADIMNTELGDKLTVAGRPAQAATESIDYFVEGWTEEYGPESLVFTFNVSPSAPYDEVLIIGDPDRGAIGINPIAY